MTVRIDLAALEQLAAEAQEPMPWDKTGRTGHAAMLVPTATVAALIRAVRVLEDFANPQHWAVRRHEDGSYNCVWIGTYMTDPIAIARQALKPFDDAGAE